jgi:hypothetical protein
VDFLAGLTPATPGGLNWQSLSSTEEDAMGDVINLNRFRKARAKAEQGKQAEENRVLHGRTKAEKTQAAKERDITDRDHDGKQLT